MVTCAHCGQDISETCTTKEGVKTAPHRYSGDARVCSAYCANARQKSIMQIDKTMENPQRWVGLIHSRSGIHSSASEVQLDASQCPTQTKCATCEAAPALISCPWCRSSDAVQYCSISCQHRDWISGHSTVCWRYGRAHPKSPPTIGPQGMSQSTLQSLFGYGCPGWISRFI